MNTNDLSEYVVKSKGKFYVDSYDVETGDPIWENDVPFTFKFGGKTYKGTTNDELDDGEVSEVVLMD